MDDSNILYYIVIGAIYVISRILKKKKQDPQSVPTDSSTGNTVHETPKKSPSGFEDLFKELTGEDFSKKPADQPDIIEKPQVQAEIIPTYTDYEQELTDIASNKPIEREKPVFKRNENFKIKEQETLDDKHAVHDLFKDTDDLRKAVILKEILDRKY